MTTTGFTASGALSFPPGFVWGAATAAYQIEGAVSEDGRGASVWDTFSHTPGKVYGDDNGDIACDSYHRYLEDVEVLAGLGLGSYRFSVSWPRIQPGGRGAVNQKGIDYYRALLDELGERGIDASVTLFHWDLPQELQDEGGWAVRSTAQRFADYAAIVGELLGDRVARWITLNEPQVVVSHGYRGGVHAPGLNDAAAAAAATHHLLLGHGLATQALRSVVPAATPVGISLDFHPVLVDGPERGGSVEEAVAITDAELNRIFFEPLRHGRYPEGARARMLPPDALIADGDLETIAAPIDFLGINYYAPVYLRAGDPADLRRDEEPAPCAVPGVVECRPARLERTSMGWLVNPEGLYGLLLRLAQEAPDWELYITENGRGGDDYVNPQGVVHDPERIRYLHTHLEAAARAIRDGANLAGYFVWSLLDNFEWGYGYQKRFGIVFVDFGTQRRIPKESAGFFSAVVQANAVPPLPDGSDAGPAGGGGPG